MKLKFGKSSVTVTIEDEEDMYTLYRFLRPGDLVGSKTSRRIKGDEEGSKSSRQLVYIEIQVEKVSFFGFAEALRISGRITQSSESSITLNSYHSLKVGLHQQLSISTEGRHPSDFDMLKERQVGDRTGRVIVVIDDDEVHAYAVGTRATKLLVEITPSITRKGSDAKQYEMGLLEFFGDILHFLHDYSKESNIDELIVAGPGFTKDRFMDFLKERNTDLSKITRMVEVKGTGRRGLLEVVREHLGDTDAGREALLIHQAMENLAKGNDKTLYGMNEIIEVVENGAIESLLILDELLYESVERRAEIDNISSKVRNFGGKVYLISSRHPGGEQIKGLGGIVALLRYPVQF